MGWDTPLSFVDGVPFLAKGGYRLGRVLPIVGIDGLITDRPDLARALLEQRGIRWR